MSWLNEDRDRLDGFREGRTETLQAVYLHYAPKLAKILASGLSIRFEGGLLMFACAQSPFDLDDLVQETFVHAFEPRARMSYDGTRPYMPFLTTMARNLIVDAYRKKSRHARWVEKATGEAPLPTPPQSPEEAAVGKQLAGIYTKFLQSLDEQSRALWEHRFVDGQPRRIVQEKTGLSAMQVRTLEKRLRNRLHQDLAEAGFSFDIKGIIVVVIWIFPGAINLCARV